jgi:aminopeptidase N
VAAAGGSDAGLKLDDVFIDAMRKMLTDDTLDPAFREQALLLPSETMIAEQMDVVDPQAIHTARQFMRATSAPPARRTAGPVPGQPDAGRIQPGRAVGRQARAEEPGLSYLMRAPDEEALKLAQRSSTKPAT